MVAFSRAVELARERDAVFGPQLLDQRDGFFEAGEAFLDLGPFDAEDDLVERLARSDPEDDAARKQRAERRERLGHDGRVVAERRRQHGGADQDALRARPEGAEPRDRGGRMATLVHERLEMVGDEHRVETCLLGQHSISQQIARAELFGGGLVAEAQGNGHGGSPQLGINGVGTAWLGVYGLSEKGFIENVPLRSRKVCA